MTTSGMESSLTVPETPTPPDASQPAESSGDGAVTGVSTGSMDDLADSTGIDIEAEATNTMAPFRAWRAVLEDQLHAATDALVDVFQAVQTQSDTDAVFVRGEAGWRKHMTLLNDRLGEVVRQELESLTTRIGRHADSAVDALNESIMRSQASAKRALAKQADMYQDKLRRTRTALKKEMDRFATLETCLRAEQARQREALHEQKIKETTDAYHDREAHLHATLRDLRAAYNNVEMANEQLLEALRASRRETEQLKNTLIASRGSDSPTSRHGTRRGSSFVFGATSPGRGGMDPTSSMLKNMAMTASEIVEQNLRQALATVNKEFTSAKQQIVELEREQRASDKREQQAQDATAKVQGELVRATSLLAEAKAELVAGAERIAQLEKEREMSKNEQRELQFRLDAKERRVEDLTRVDDAHQEYVGEVERRLQRLELRSARLHALEDAFTEWKSHHDGPSDDLKQIIAEFVSGDSQPPDDMYSDSQSVTEAKLRLGFEKRFSDQLGLRVAHERKRLLARLEMLCSREKQSENELTGLVALLSSSSSRTSDKRRLGKRNALNEFGRSLYMLLSRLVRDAYDDLGVCVGAWTSTDLDALFANASRLEKEIVIRDERIVAASTQLEVQRMALARSELLQSEKEALIAELTDRCRQLRSALEESNGAKEEAAKRAGIPIARQPLTVYGISQSIEVKLGRRSSPITAIPTQSRPMSAAPSFPAKSTIPSPSRLGSLGSNPLMTGKTKVASGKWTEPIREEEDAPEHVRSVLKSQLMKSEPNNQQDGGLSVSTPPPLGADGVSSLRLVFVELHANLIYPF